MAHVGTALVNPYKVFEKIKLAEGMRVADFGCGRTGHFVFPSAKIVGEKGVVYAVDILKDVLESIKSMARSEGYENVKTIWSDVEVPGKTPVPANSLDACFFVNILFQMKAGDKVVAEAARLLLPGGALVIIDWLKRLGPLGPTSEQTVVPETVMRWANAASLDLDENSKMSDYHYMLIFKKRA